MSESIDVSVHVDPSAGAAVDADSVAAAVEHVLRAEAVEAAEISVAFVGDDRIAALNREYLHHEGPTDVISFPLDAPEGQGILGDIYVGADQAARQAAEHAVPLNEEILRLAVHGVLHVLGYDHPDDGEREGSPMYIRQEQLLAAILENGRR